MYQDKNWDKCNKKDMKRKKEVDYSIVPSDVEVLEMRLESVPVSFEVMD